MSKIVVNLGKLGECVASLQQLSNQSITISDALSESIGNAANAEKEIIAVLKAICETDLPAMFTSTASLLNNITADFSQAEHINKTNIQGKVRAGK